MDYTKGILERLRALSTLFRTRPELRGELTFVQVGVPSRSSIPEYARLEQQLDAEVTSINQTWGTDRWTPILFEKRNLPPVEMMALHRLAHFCAVTPLHDGMNLVAKEFVASRFDGDGTLILSRFAGAAQELKTALLVNPYSETELCAAIETALFMPRVERRQRMKAAREVVEKNNVYRWAGELLDAAASIARVQTTTARLRYASRTASVA
jgi:trehalose 6-phosphate synthase